MTHLNDQEHRGWSEAKLEERLRVLVQLLTRVGLHQEELSRQAAILNNIHQLRALFKTEQLWYLFDGIHDVLQGLGRAVLLHQRAAVREAALNAAVLPGTKVVRYFVSSAGELRWNRSVDRCRRSGRFRLRCALLLGSIGTLFP